MMSTFGYTNAFGVYQDFYTRSHVASASRTSWIGSTQLFLLTVTGLFAGKLVDLGYFRQTVFAGSLIYVFSCVLFLSSLADRDWCSWCVFEKVCSCSLSRTRTSIIRSFSRRALGWASVLD